MRHFSVFLLGVLFLFLVACGQLAERKQPPMTLYQLSQQMDLNLSGEQLAKGYCAACHGMPKPDIMEKAAWKTILPDMRKRMGLYLEEDLGDPLPEDEGIPEGIYSKTPYITRDKWKKLEAYYLENAPNVRLPQPLKEAPQLGIPSFQLEVPKFDIIRASLTTLVRVHPSTGNLLVGDRLRALYHLDTKKGFLPLDSLPTAVAPVDLAWREDGSFDLLAMGMMDSANGSLGQLTQVTSLSMGAGLPVLDRLMRPLDVEVGDWNGDGAQDYAISQFGNHLGKLSLFLSGPTGFQEKVLKQEPGAGRMLAMDYDRDGDLDLLVLMTQAKEGLLLFDNLGAGVFKEKELLAFHPAFGASDFRMEDLNGDGKFEIVLTNGYNADQQQVLKSYQGLHLFSQNVEGEYQEKWFYPLYGASGVELGDFDEDGKHEIAVISFFGDPKEADEQQFLYFKQDKAGKYRPHGLAERLQGSWMTLTKGDLDLDGDLDLVLGAYLSEELYQPPFRPWRPFVILRNTLR